MRSKKGVVILGSTGSIGCSTLDVIRLNETRFRVIGLTGNRNVSLLAKQIKEHKPEIVSVGVGLKDNLKTCLGKGYKELTILEGEAGNVSVAETEGADQVIAAIVGSAGLKPVFAAIQSGKEISLANKETLVLAGDLMIKEAMKYNVTMLPLDSEHNAIFQCLQGNERKDLDHIILTASGGPFRMKDISEFEKITREEALNHPNWDMGAKITIDSATMMNKCLEIIEAKWLFDLKLDQIKVLVHPQSIVHSMVVFKDGSTLAQLGVPDMKTPIANCLGYPNRIDSGSAFIDWQKTASLNFEQPDLEKFPSLRFAFDALKLGGGAPAALNGANEELVDLFLKQKISFTAIFKNLENMLTVISNQEPSGKKQVKYLYEIATIEDAIMADKWGRKFITEQINDFIN